MSEKLKQCPFCKGEFAFDFEAKNFRCGTCGATVPPDPYARTVNTRPIEDELTARIAELEAERRWIPVSERMPDDWESVLTIDISKSTRDAVTAFYNPETSLWSTHFSCDLWVTHWMPLPEPPIVYGKVCEE